MCKGHVLIEQMSSYMYIASLKERTTEKINIDF